MFSLLALFACGSPTTEGPAASRDDAAHEGADHHAEGAAKDQRVDASAARDGWSHYGDAFTKDSAVACASVTADPSANVDQVIRVEGHIENVCQKAGCWMVVAGDDGEYLRITMKDHAFGVPTDTRTGQDTRVDVEGTLIQKTLDEKTLAHLKSEAKGDPDAVAKQLAPKYEIVATGVSIKQM